jgi:hypothetical protein
MPQIIVKADRTDDREEGAVMLRERVNITDFESEHFAAQLVERLGWAVGDAHEAEQSKKPAEHGDQKVRDYRSSASVVTTAS